VEESAYWKLIGQSMGNIDLTTRNDCLVCGAYESLAVGNPIILSNNEASTSYFGNHCLFTNNTVEDLKERIIELVENSLDHKKKSLASKEHFIESDNAKKNELNTIIQKVRNLKPHA
jgi:glycosyltransferase involved in cell wall biosynthesis